MKLEEIQELIKFVSKTGVSEVEIEQKDFKIVIKSDKEKKSRRGRDEAAQAQFPAQAMPQQQVMPAQQPVQQQQPQAPAPQPDKPAAKEDDESKYVTVKSPMIGTFYRSSSPEKDPFVNVGDTIKEGKVICIIEAMKLFNEIEAEVSGKIVKVLVDDSSPVEFDQPLFLVDPS